MAHRKRVISIVGAVLVLTACAAAPPPPTDRLTSDACREAKPAETRGLTAEWEPFFRYVYSCEVKDGIGKTVIVVLAVSADRYYEQLPSGTATVPMPKPLLLAAGETIGALPMNFPDDPPFVLRVTFADWSAGWPGRIELFVEDPTVTGNHAIPPLVWDAATRRFAPQAEK